MNSKTYQRGVALVITLILLSIITILAVGFLAMSRRSRGSVSVTQNQTDAKMMADTALARAQSEITAQMMAHSNLLSYDYFVSQNYINTNGFNGSLPLRAATNALDPILTNVNYEWRSGGGPLSPDQLIVNIGNLFYDPRPPVVIITNSAYPTRGEFRYFLDFNRNNRFDTNGYLPVLFDPTVRAYANGDPHWIGVLERPEFPHSPTNRFIGRYSFLVLPAGKTLDINYNHNFAKGNNRGGPGPGAGDGFNRNEGFGSWEINLAALFAVLNTNVWPNDRFETNGATPSWNPPRFTPTNYLDANTILQYRYGTNFHTLGTFPFGSSYYQAFANDGIDDFANGPSYLNAQPSDDDLTLTNGVGGLWYWPGNDSTGRYYTIETLFDTNRLDTNLIFRVAGGNPGRLTNGAPYDVSTFYRFLSQVGTESAAELEGKTHLNYAQYYSNKFQGTLSFTNFIPWEPVAFFTNVASRLITNSISHRFTNNVEYFVFDEMIVPTNFALTNIQIYPTNFYTPALHRLLQLTANIYDATTNKSVVLPNTLTNTGYPYYPSVFKPVFGRNVGGVQGLFITGFTEETNAAFLTNVWMDAQQAFLSGGIVSNVNIYGQPVVVGAKKGWPNFNEFALQSIMIATRKLEVRRTAVNKPPFQTNQMFILGISNIFGVESWNSYTQAFARPLTVVGLGQAAIVLTNETGRAVVFTNLSYNGTNFFQPSPGVPWNSREYQLPLFTNQIALSNSIYSEAAKGFLAVYGPATQTNYERGVGFPVHSFGYTLTNRLQYWALDGPPPVSQADYARLRVVDMVNFQNMTSDVDITGSLAGLTNEFGQGEGLGRYWFTNRVRNSSSIGAPTIGISNQVWVGSHGDPIAFPFNTYSNQIWSFSNFIYNPSYTNADLTKECPYSPTRQMHKIRSWQVNDPLVHYMLSDLEDALSRTNIATPYTTSNAPSLLTLTLKIANDSYKPWDGNPFKTQPNDANAHNLAVKDPLIYQSDDWDFPTNKFPNIGWLGRVHRGTPWQTVYFKSFPAVSNLWTTWARSTMATHPTNDWRLLDMFTVAPNENAAKGLLSVNQGGEAAWSAVLGGVTTLSNTAFGTLSKYTPQTYDAVYIQPNTAPIRRVIDSINQWRQNQSNQVFNSIGDVLGADALTVNSPYLNVDTNATENVQAPGDPHRIYTVSDAAYERIPQQIGSLLQLGNPRFVIYSYGQSLKPADQSIITSAPDPRLINLCTNYQITAEVVTRTVMRVEGTPNNPRVVIENFQILSGD